MSVKINFYKTTFNENELLLMGALLDNFDKFSDADILLAGSYSVEDKQIEISCNIRRIRSAEFEVILSQEDIKTSQIEEIAFAFLKRKQDTCEISILESNVCHVDFLQTELNAEIEKALAIILKNYPIQNPFLFPDVIYKFDTVKIVLAQTFARRPWVERNKKNALYFPDKFEVLGGEEIFANVSETLGVVCVYLIEDQIFFKKTNQRKYSVVNKVQSTGAKLEYIFDRTQEELRVLNAAYPKAGKKIIAFTGYDGRSYTYFFMRKFPGVRLSDYLQHNKMRSLLQAVAIMNLCTRSVMKYHNKNFIHCDIKPENIHIDTKNAMEIFLLDAGSAKSVNIRVRYMNGVTAGYRAPELQSVLVHSRIDDNKLKLTTAIDVFALLGVFLKILGDDDALNKKASSDNNGDSYQTYQFSNKLFSTITDTDNEVAKAELKALLTAMNTYTPTNREPLDMVYEKLSTLEKNLKNNSNNLLCYTK